MSKNIIVRGRPIMKIPNMRGYDDDDDDGDDDGDDDDAEEESESQFGKEKAQKRQREYNS